jgi:hypothetical protein
LKGLPAVPQHVKVADPPEEADPVVLAVDAVRAAADPEVAAPQAAVLPELQNIGTT